MELTFQGHEEIAAPRDTVWRRLLDPEAVARAAPGVEAIRVVDSTHWEVDVQAGIGPVAVAIRLAATLHDLEPPTAARMDLDGTGAGSHIVLATRLRLEAPTPARTVLHWEADARVEGSLARLGRGIVELAARAFTHDFWRRFAEQAAAAVLPEPGAGAQIPVAAAPAAPLLPLRSALPCTFPG